MFSEHLCFCFVYFKQNSLTLFLVVSETLVSKTTKLNLWYMEPKPGYTLEQLWADSEPAISKKTTTSYEVQTSDVLRAVAAIQHLIPHATR